MFIDFSRNAEKFIYMYVKEANNKSSKENLKKGLGRRIRRETEDLWKTKELMDRKVGKK